MFTKSTELEKGKNYFSDNKKYFLTFQNDGNLVLYKIIDNKNIYTWATMTINSDKKGIKCVFQADGNFVIYNALNIAVWATMTNNKSADNIRIQDDGKLVMYSSNYKVLWKAQTKESTKSQSILIKSTFLEINKKYFSNNKKYFLTFQDDGNLVLYKIIDNKNIFTWATMTNGNGIKCVFQDDGNFVIYNSKDFPIWATMTNNKSADNIKIQDDGNLVMYSSNYQVLWNTQTNESKSSNKNNSQHSDPNTKPISSKNGSSNVPALNYILQEMPSSENANSIFCHNIRYWNRNPTRKIKLVVRYNKSVHDGDPCARYSHGEQITKVIEPNDKLIFFNDVAGSADYINATYLE